jgi:hypothetical protein
MVHTFLQHIVHLNTPCCGPGELQLLLSPKEGEPLTGFVLSVRTMRCLDHDRGYVVGACSTAELCLTAGRFPAQLRNSYMSHADAIRSDP